MDPIPGSTPIAPTPELPDAEVVRRVVDGEVELFELLMRRYNQRLFRVVRGVIDDTAEAEDVLQDAWVRAFEHLASFRGEALFSTWLARIAVHEAFARLKRGRRFVGLAPESEASLPASGLHDPERVTASVELRGVLESVVGAMPSGYRAVFLMREVEGLSTAETAACLELSEEAVKVRLHRAKARLRADLDQRLGETSASLFGFAGWRCDRTVAAVMARIAGH
jgi:RNA polymerase sigma-70 factor (ECF subfamily)